MNIDVRLVAGRFAKLRSGEVSTTPLEFYDWAIGKQWRAMFEDGPKWFRADGTWSDRQNENDVVELLEKGVE